MKRLMLMVLCLASLVACGSAAPKAATTTADSTGKKLAPIARVTPPITITEQQAKVDWVVVNYWNTLNMADTAYIGSPELEQAFVDWIAIMPYVAPEKRQEAFLMTFKKAAAADRAMLDEFLGVSERYLYDPNSPMRNENIYIDVLRAELALPALEEIEKIRPQAQLDLALKNRVGQKATDFSYQTVDGAKGRMNGVKSEFLVLYFNNPDCPNCKEVTAQLNVATRLRELDKAGRLRVLAVYPDQDHALWVDHAANMPPRWINASCELSVKSDEIYDLRAIPNLYLLDKDKKVILKDCTANQLIGYLESVK